MKLESDKYCETKLFSKRNMYFETEEVLSLSNNFLIKIKKMLMKVFEALVLNYVPYN